MRMFRDVLLSSIAALVVHLSIILVLGGAPTTVFIAELGYRWLLAALILHSLNWRFPLIISGAVLGGLFGLHMAFVVMTFGQPVQAGLLAFITHSLVGAVMGSISWLITRKLA